MHTNHIHEFSRHFLLFFEHNTWLANIFIILISMSLFHWFSRKIYHFLMRKFGGGRHPWVIAFFQAMHAPWLTFFWLMIVSFIIPIIMRRFHIDLSHIQAVNAIRSLFFVGAFYWSFLSFISKIENDIAPRWKRLPIRDKTTVRALAQLARITLTLVAVLLALPSLGFKTGSLLAFGGVGGLGVALAAKETLSNVLGGMMLFWDRPFSVGDWIRSPDRQIEGNVEHIGWRLTRIRTLAKCLLYVPNSVFSTIIIENPQRMSHRHLNQIVGVRYDDARVIAPITQAVEAMLRAHPAIDTTQSVMVTLVELAASSLNLNLYAYVKVTESAKFRQFVQEILLKTIAIIAEHGAECAFPTTMVLMKHDDAQSGK